MCENAILVSTIPIHIVAYSINTQGFSCLQWSTIICILLTKTICFIMLTFCIHNLCLSLKCNNNTRSATYFAMIIFLRWIKLLCSFNLYATLRHHTSSDPTVSKQTELKSYIRAFSKYKRTEGDTRVHVSYVVM